jgi:hypothetical protein
MISLELWWLFWTVCFVVAGGGFFLVATVVLIRGFNDLRQMVRFLSARSPGSNRK